MRDARTERGRAGRDERGSGGVDVREAVPQHAEGASDPRRHPRDGSVGAAATAAVRSHTLAFNRHAGAYSQRFRAHAPYVSTSLRIPSSAHRFRRAVPVVGYGVILSSSLHDKCKIIIRHLDKPVQNSCESYPIMQ
ncbi:hypothetical protein EVAR_48189_1 [Eumeta japonica]|uniref:Uncharacterized protein n=1 Tax=Eumeta variegata TaxID=151549 RepID=A0A4C1XUY7_EUMVA|nr:hypothetical protein EVAR_48189_1 [Eumeta japonica]